MDKLVFCIIFVRRGQYLAKLFENLESTEAYCIYLKKKNLLCFSELTS